MRAPTRVSALLLAGLVSCAGLLAGAVPASAAFGDRILRQGMQGGDVKTLQRKLNKLGVDTGVDGLFGSGTKQSMQKWERRNDRNVNGVCSRSEARIIKRQVRALRTDAERTPDAEEPAPTPESGTTLPQRKYASRRLAKGARGTDVKRLQRNLSSIGIKTPVDGVFGPATVTSMKKWEAWQYLRADGVATGAQQKKIRGHVSTASVYKARHHVFPVRGPHSYGGAGSRFGAPRSGRTHQGQDVSAAHGTPLVAVHSGKVVYRQYQAGGAGHYLVIHGNDGSDSVYMHMPRPAIVAPGDRVRAGERIGRVGTTGSSTGPHLHFELWTQHWYAGGSPYDPLWKLKRWDRQTP